MKRIIYHNSAGALCVVIPAENAMLASETEDDFVSRIMKSDIPAGATDIAIIEAADIPIDRTFRNAWMNSKGAIIHDMDKAREIQKDKMRLARAPLLRELDISYQRADEAGDSEKKKEVAAQKQALRDVTKDPAILAASTVEDLKVVWPDALASTAAANTSR